MGVPHWVDGTAMYYIVRDPMFGSTGPVGWLLYHVTDSSLGVVAVTWGSILVELAIAACLLMPGRIGGKPALVLDICFHASIIAAIGLWSFGSIMIASVLVATIAPSRRRVSNQPTQNRPPAIQDDAARGDAAVVARDEKAVPARSPTRSRDTSTVAPR